MTVNYRHAALFRARSINETPITSLIHHMWWPGNPQIIGGDGASKREFHKE